MKTTILLLTASLCGSVAFSQTSLYGKVTDADTGEPIIFCSVALYKNGVLANGTETDFDGNYTFPEIGPGAYEVETTYVGFAKKRISDVKVLEGKANRLDIEMASEGVILDEVVVTEYRVPLVEMDNTTSGAVITSSRVRPGSSGGGRAAHRKKGKGKTETPSVRGSRRDATDYYIDGIRVRGGLVPEGGAPSTPATPAGPAEAAAPGVPAGQLTAGEWSDLDNWETWAELLEEDFLPYTQAWELAPRNRFTVEVKNNKGVPVANCRARLMSREGKVLWTALTDNNGLAELWADDAGSPESIELDYREYEARIGQPQPRAKGINQAELKTGCPEATAADVFFVVDATGSMTDEINYLKAELEDAILRVESNLPDTELRTGALFYRDHNDAYLTRSSPLTAKLDSTLAFIRQQGAQGGGDGPEAVEVALAKALQEQNWNPAAATRLIFLILDAPPHQTPVIRQGLKQSIQQAAEMGIKIIPVTGSGIDKSTEYLMKALAISTNGTYAFLTSHSGIGGGHIEPTSGPYEVQFLNDLLVKLILENAIQKPCGEEAGPVLPPPGKLNPALLSRVKCFPNPATGQFYLRLEKGFDRLAVRNLEGRLIQEKEKLNKGDHEFDAANWAPGLYLLELHKGDEAAVEKLVVERRP
ncbi:MAG: carboxypeptidase regulatory-like domain-containing protein [Lewinellaceae bacterium]|nr:carboxypeptidase regulatory-like domain-containing protein [Lewinellaceae bacterium]